MSPAQLLAHFDRISEAPGAVARLRRFILDLAIRGKLVEQDPRDEPAAELLKRIQVPQRKKQNEKSRSPESTISANELPYPNPPNWLWLTLRDLCVLENGDRSKNYPSRDEFVAQGVPFINAGHLQAGSVSMDSMNYIGRQRFELLKSGKVREGDLLFCLRGSLGKVALVGRIDAGAIASSLVIVRAPNDLNVSFLLHYFSSSLAKQMVERFDNGTAQPNLSSADLAKFLVPLAPMAEQARIVARVDELMALCDRLEAAQAERERRRDRLVAASPEHLTEAIGPNEGRQAALFYLQQLPRFATRANHLERLKDSVLELAVTGRLTSQQPSDGDGATLLTSLGRSKKGMRKASEDRQASISLPDLPGSWTWAVIDDLAAAQPNASTDGPFGANLKTAHYVQTPGYRVIRLQNVGHGDFRDEHQAFIERKHFERLAKHHVGPGDLIVAGLVGPLVRCCEVPQNIGPALVKADCYRYKVHPNVSSRFVLHYLNSPVCQRFASSHHHGMTLLRIGLGNFRRIPIPVPPLAEQRRIVAKVDEPMAICDKLEAQLSTVETESTRLLEATIQQALSAA